MKSRLSFLAFSLLVACSTPQKQSRDSIDLARRQVTDPRDARARSDLAKLRVAEGVWGEALREYLILEGQQNLEAEDREALGKLLVARAKERVALDDPAAIEDLDHASRLGVDAAKLLPPALRLAAVSALRHSSSFTRERAEDHLARLRSIAPDDRRFQKRALEELEEAELVERLAWFQSAGARRQALRVAERYIQAGGREEGIVDQWLELHRWWYGDRRPPLPTELALQGAKETPRLQRLESYLQAQREASGESVSQALRREWKLDLFGDKLVQIEENYARDPARADRLARNFVDEDVYGAVQIAAVAELYQRLGDRSRAKAWAIELATLSPGMPGFSLVAGLACAIDGDLGPAEQYFVKAAAASGDPGHYWGIAAKTLRLAGQPLAAVAALRRGMELTAPGRDMHLLYELSLAQRALGRAADAATTTQTLLGRFAEAEQAQAKERIREGKEREASGVGVRPPFVSAIRGELGLGD